jgi:protocatechuate 3,4-dioxygenase beta subunit
VVARADAGGLFELDGAHHGRLFVRDHDWTTLLAGVPVDQRSGQECRIVVARSLALDGFVLDEQGLPLGGARVALAAPPTLRASLAEVLDFAADVPWETRTDEHGRFHLAAAPAIEEGVLRAELEGYVPHVEPAPLVARNDLVLVLARPAGEGASLRGRVVDGSGLPVADAMVSYGIDTTRTDEDGRFAFSVGDPASFNHMAARFGMHVPEGLLRALKRGFLPAELRAARGPEGRLEWPRPIVLRLGSEPLTLAGRVLDARGEPLADMRVWIADPTFFGGLVRDSSAERFPQLVQVEALLDDAGPGWTWAESDGDGRFELHGLTEREYTVAAMDPATLQRTDLPGVAAGRRNVVLVLATDELLPRLAGRVLDGRGKPVANLAVFPMCDALETRIEGETVSTEHEAAPGTSTDENGWFLLERVPEHAVYLRIQGADTIPLEWGRGLAGGLAELAANDPEELLITVERRCHFQVELAVPDEADELGVLDAEGHALTISEFFGSGRRDDERHPIVAGRSSTLAVGDRAATLVLYRAGSEVRRVALALEPAAPASLRL